MKTVIATLVRKTAANLYIKINNHTVTVPVHQVAMYTESSVTFHHSRDAYHIYKMTA